jgi:hypothetical protein
MHQIDQAPGETTVPSRFDISDQKQGDTLILLKFADS